LGKTICNLRKGTDDAQATLLWAVGLSEWVVYPPNGGGLAVEEGGEQRRSTVRPASMASECSIKSTCTGRPDNTRLDSGITILAFHKMAATAKS